MAGLQVSQKLESDFSAAVRAVRAGKLVRLDLLTAHAVIRETQGLGEAWGCFLEEAPTAVLHARYRPPSILAMREEIAQDVARLRLESTESLAEEVMRICDFAALHAQRNEIELPGCSARLIFWRLPCEEEFDRARRAMLFALEFFRIAAHSAPCQGWNDRGITLTIRGMERNFDLDLDSIGVNDRALVGFDFTDLDDQREVSVSEMGETIEIGV